MRMPIQEHMRPQDIAAFQAAARFYRLYILVRRTNPASLRYIGQPGYAPKRLDCKAKTADFDAAVAGRRRELAGLVVDPRLAGPAAFRTGKYQEALEEWEKLAPHLPPGGTQAGKVYIPNGGFYVVQTDPAHRHYGCLMFASNSLISAARYIHGDYDLYAVVREDEPSRNVFVSEERLGQKHARSRDFFDTQHFLNRRIGAPMVQHGEQETYMRHTDETLDLFRPDGGVEEVSGRAAIKRVYRELFEGRASAGKGVPTREVFGQWRKPG
jgi:hypothetical protein